MEAVYSFSEGFLYYTIAVGLPVNSLLRIQQYILNARNNSIILHHVGLYSSIRSGFNGCQIAQKEH